MLVESLGFPGFPHYSFKYSILELDTAIKPWFLLHLRRTYGLDRICYFDPDILVTGDLTEIYQRLGADDVLLTPHITAPVEDSRIPSSVTSCSPGSTTWASSASRSMSGRCSSSTGGTGGWPRSACTRSSAACSWISAGWTSRRLLAGPRCCRDAGCNVAYWNLMHRTLIRRDGGWWVDATAGGIAGEPVPLRFFHFSGFSLDRPEQISKYQNRFVLDDRPDLQPLFRDYCERLIAAGHRELSRLPYRFGVFDNGTPVPPLARVALRAADPEGRRWPDPFATTGADPFLDWLRAPRPPQALHRPAAPRPASLGRPAGLAAGLSAARQRRPRALRRVVRLRRRDPGVWRRLPPAGGRIAAPGAPPLAGARAGAAPQALLGAERRRRARQRIARRGDLLADADAGHEPARKPRVPRLALMLYQRRSDLRTSFPDPLGEDRADFALWFATHGRLEYRFPYRVVFPVLRTLPLRKAVLGPSLVAAPADAPRGGGFALLPSASWRGFPARPALRCGGSVPREAASRRR